jgi:DNA-directed RNA polymerase
MSDDLADLSRLRFRRKDRQRAKAFGYEETVRGRALWSRCLKQLTGAIKGIRRAPETAMEDAFKVVGPPHGGRRGGLWVVLKRVDPAAVALAILSGAIRVIGMRDDEDRTIRVTQEQIGHNLRLACRSARLLRKDKAGYRNPEWDDDRLHTAGGWGVDVLLHALPDMFELVQYPVEGGKPYEFENYVQLTAQSEKIGAEVLRACIRNDPHHLPTSAPPQPWTDVVRYGHRGERQTLIRCRLDSPIMEAARKALKSDRREWIDALHKLESVGYRINEPMYRFVLRAYELTTFEKQHGLDFLWVDEPIYCRKWNPEKLRWDKRRERWTKGAWDRALYADKGERSKGEELTFATDMLVAEKLLGSTFYTPMNFCTRGRIYPIPNFNFTRGDHIRALFEFAEGKTLGREGLKALKIHLANVAAGFDKSRPGNMTDAEKIEWVDARLARIGAIGRAAIEHHEVEESLLAEVDDRFQFVRGCVELYEALRNPRHRTHLPVLFDATSSGLQHYCLLMRDKEGGSLVNLVPGLLPQDFYQTAADEVAYKGQFLVRKWETKRPKKRSRTKLKLPIMVDARVPGVFLELGERGRRKFAKGVLVPDIYSASAREMSKALRSVYRRGDHRLFNPRRVVMTLLRTEFEEGKFLASYGGEFWEFSVKDNELSDGGEFWGFSVAEAAERKHIVSAAVDAVIAARRKLMPKPEKAKLFLQKLARLMALENKSLAMSMPSGFPWHSRYHEPKKKTWTTRIRGRDVKCTITVGDLPTVDKNPSIRAAAPNFIHGHDGALMHLVALAIDGPFLGVHDGFGFLAPDALRGRAKVHDRLAQMYLDHDPLEQILEAVRKALSPEGREKLPPLPERGDPQMIEDCRNAEYITS